MGIKGREGTVLLRRPKKMKKKRRSPKRPRRMPSEALNVPNRSVYAIDLRIEAKPEVFLSEIRRIVREATVETVTLDFFGLSNGSAPHHAVPVSAEASKTDLTGTSKRRWYPVIDYSRCTNCMECIDFCLFGVYGLDEHDTILVEQQDNCKKGCPACSRVCPENAIIFPGAQDARHRGRRGRGVAGLQDRPFEALRRPVGPRAGCAGRDTRAGRRWPDGGRNDRRHSQAAD